MKDREVILGVLRRVVHRLQVRRTLQQSGFSACVVLFTLIALQLASPVPMTGVSVTGTGVRTVVVALLAILAAGIVWRALRQVTLAQAAGEADARAHLRDELKSAYWFVSSAEHSPFTELQVARAAATASRLDPNAIVPIRPPHSLFAAAGLGAVLVLTTWMTPQLSHSWGTAGAAPVTADEGPGGLRALLKDAPKDAEVEKLDRALEALQHAGSSADEKMRAVAEARDAMGQADMEAAAAREGLAMLAEAMKANPRFEKAAQALGAGRNQEAMELLREMQAEAGKEGAGAANAEEEDIPLADKGGVSEASLEEQFDKTGRDLRNVNADAGQDTIDRVLKTLEQANEQIEVQNRLNQVKRRIENVLGSIPEQSELAANRLSSQGNAPEAAPSPDTGNAEMRGGTLYREDAAAARQDDEPGDASKPGSPSGHSAALALEGTATTRLDAQLKLETIQRRDEGGKDGDKGDQGWFYSASRQQQSVLAFRDVRARANFDREDVMSHERIPIRQKQIVKNYFLNLHESEKK